MSNKSSLFATEKQLYNKGFSLTGNVFTKDEKKFLPLYEGKMIHLFDHRWASFIGSKFHENSLSLRKDSNFLANGRYWVKYDDVNNWLNQKKWKKNWFIGLRNITNSTNERTIIVDVFPKNPVGHSINIVLINREKAESILSMLSSFVCDYIIRLKIGGENLSNFIINQLPVLSPNVFDKDCLWSPNETNFQFIMKRVIELTYTAYDLEPFADDSGYSGPPFKWDDKRRFLLKCELDAALFHLYLTPSKEGHWIKVDKENQVDFAELTKEFSTPRAAVDFVMDTFSLVEKNDTKSYGEYLTKSTILEMYDQMLEAMASGKPYQTKLDPPPADPSCRHS
jgi:hypothetical protein